MTWAMPVAVNLPNLKTFWVIDIDFVEPLFPSLRWTTREAMTIGGVAFSLAPIERQDIERLCRLEEIVVFNEAKALTGTFYDQPLVGGGIRIWQGYGEGATWAYSQLREVFNGVFGAIGIGSSIRIRLKPQSYRQTPPVTIGDVIGPEFRIPDGAEAITPDGKVILTQARI